MIYPKKSLVIALLIWILVFLTFLISFKRQEVIIADFHNNIDSVDISDGAHHTEIRDQYLAVKKEKKPKVKEQKISETSNNSDQPRIIHQPLPQIPPDLRYEAYNSYAIARFYIAADGSAKVELIKPCSNPKLNYLLLQSLKQWKFEKSDHNSVRDIKVEFKVE